MVSNAVRDKDMIKLWDKLEDERKDRYKNRYIVEHNLHAQDLKGDHITHARRLNRIAPERFEEQKRRGYDIIDNKAYGKAHHDKHFHESFTKNRVSPWEKVMEGRGEETPTSAAAVALDRTNAGTGRSLTHSSSAQQVSSSRPSPSVA